jgi:hypothetical protein
MSVGISFSLSRAAANGGRNQPVHPTFSLLTGSRRGFERQQIVIRVAHDRLIRLAARSPHGQNQRLHHSDYGSHNN